ncbi:MAG TPA: cupredoxin domain-containing protein [Candidatus Limnocylindrales bacterium]
MTSNRHRLSAVALMIFVSVALAACNTPAATTSPAGNSTAPGASAGSVQSAVSISNFAFAPLAITVPVGTTVTWTNQDSADHTIVSDDGKTFTSTNVAKGATYSFTFAAAGTFAYHCGIHPTMKGTVIVTP